MIIIFRGIPGGGKTTAINFLRTNHRERNAAFTGMRSLVSPELFHQLDELWEKIEDEHIAHRRDLEGGRRLVLASADDAFIQPNGEYVFDPAKLSAAHGQSLAVFTEGLIAARAAHVSSPNAPERPRIVDEVASRLASSAFNKEVRQAMDHAPTVLISDNTNTSIAEVAPYAAQANAFGHELHIVTLLANPTKAWRRNIHGVPLTQVIKMSLALEQSIREWPPWWPQQIFQED